MDFGERNSPCQLSVPSADKSLCVIAARVVPANEGTAGAVDGFGSFSTPPRGQKQSFTSELQLYQCSFKFGAGWERKKEDKAFPNRPRI